MLFVIVGLGTEGDQGMRLDWGSSNAKVWRCLYSTVGRMCPYHSGSVVMTLHFRLGFTAQCLHFACSG